MTTCREIFTVFLDIPYLHLDFYYVIRKIQNTSQGNLLYKGANEVNSKEYDVCKGCKGMPLYIMPASHIGNIQYCALCRQLISSQKPHSLSGLTSKRTVVALSKKKQEKDSGYKKIPE